jgi:hypothetical protein
MKSGLFSVPTLMTVALLSLGGCGGQVRLTTMPSSFVPFVMSEEGVTIEYPEGWYVQDVRQMGNHVAFFPYEPGPEDMVRPFTMWLVPKRHFPSLAAFADSQRDDAERRCGEPISTTVGRNAYDGLLMNCVNGNEYAFVEGATYYVSLVMNVNDANSDIFLRMRESVILEP